MADGVDENGRGVFGYVLGKGDVAIMDENGSVTIDGVSYMIHYFDERPENAHIGDVCRGEGGWEMFNGVQWVAFGGVEYEAGEGLSLDGNTFSLAATIPTKTSQLQNDSGFTTA